MRNKKKTDEELLRMLIDTMMLTAGYPDITYDDLVKRTDNWYSKYTMTEKQRDDWFKYGEELFRKERKCTAKKAYSSMQWIDLMYGLRVLKPQQELED
jgi:hypothetical protein